jgi:hypothetical protein
MALFFWPLAAAIVPAIRAARRAQPHGSRAVWMLWITALACTAALGITLEKAMPGLWMLTYAGAFAVFYLFETRANEEAPSLWQRPFHTLGVCGIAVLAYLLTFEWPWREIGWGYYRHDPAFDSLAAYFDYALAAGLPLLAGLMLAMTARRGMKTRAVYGALPLVVAAGYAVGGYDLDASGFIQIMLFNGYLFLLGIWTLIQGVTARRLRTINGGMVILIVLILTRFFDSDLSLVAKGVVFILLGAAFMIVNLAHLRRRKAVQS